MIPPSVLDWGQTVIPPVAIVGVLDRCAIPHSVVKATLNKAFRDCFGGVSFLLVIGPSIALKVPSCLLGGRGGRKGSFALV